MIDIIIIGQNEGESIQRMYNSLLHIPSKRIWILDRCTDDSEEILQKLGEFYIKTPDCLKGRQTSFSRNLGLSYAGKHSDVLFLDGDRYITNGSLNNLINWDKDIAILALQDDYRNNINDYRNCYGKVHNMFYSCGIFFKRSSINKILEFQKGELFLTSIQTDWGIEDTYLGDVCYHLRLTCDIYREALLRGKFDKCFLDTLDVIEKRFRLRDKLNVLWE